MWAPVLRTPSCPSQNHSFKLLEFFQFCHDVPFKEHLVSSPAIADKKSNVYQQKHDKSFV